MSQKIRGGRWHNLLWAATLAGTTVFGLATTTGCLVGVRARASVIADAEPPPDQMEAVPAAQPGQVWVRGHWEWRNNQWAWEPGYWQRERASYTWIDGHWERRGNRYHWIDGRWEARGGASSDGGVIVRDHSTMPEPAPNPGYVNVPAQPAMPTMPAPPAPQVEQIPAPRAGYVWVRGYWVWNGSQYQWESGHWERQQGQKRWTDGHWERSGSGYIWIEGRWE